MSGCTNPCVLLVPEPVPPMSRQAADVRVIKDLPVGRDNGQVKQPRGSDYESVSGVAMEGPGERESLLYRCQIDVQHRPPVIGHSTVEPSPPMGGNRDPSVVRQARDLRATDSGDVYPRAPIENGLARGCRQTARIRHAPDDGAGVQEKVHCSIPQSFSGIAGAVRSHFTVTLPSSDPSRVRLRALPSFSRTSSATGRLRRQIWIVFPCSTKVT